MSRKQHGDETPSQYKEKKWFDTLLAKGLKTKLIQPEEDQFPPDMDLSEAAHKMISPKKHSANLDDLITGWKKISEEGGGN